MSGIYLNLVNEKKRERERKRVREELIPHVVLAEPFDDHGLIGEARISGRERIVQVQKAERPDAIIERDHDDVLESGEQSAVGDVEVGRARVVRAAVDPEERGLERARLYAKAVRYVVDAPIRVDVPQRLDVVQQIVLFVRHRYPNVKVETVLGHAVRRIPHLRARKTRKRRVVFLSIND